MTVTFRFPDALREVAGWAPSLAVDGAPATVGDALEALRGSHPALHARIVTERGAVRPHVNLFVRGHEIRRSGGLRAPLDADAEIVVLPSVSGG